MEHFGYNRSQLHKTLVRDAYAIQDAVTRTPLGAML